MVMVTYFDGINAVKRKTLIKCTGVSNS